MLLDRDDRTLTLCGVLVLRNNRTTLEGESKSGETGNPATQFWRVNREPSISGSKLGQRGITCTA